MAAGLLAAAPLSAQAPADRAALSALHDSLAAIQFPANLATLSPDRAADRGKVMEDLRRGLLELRRGELSNDRGDFEAALQDLDDAMYREKQWPWVPYAMALTEEAMARRDMIAKPGPHQPMGMTYRETFIRDLANALERDSHFQPGVEHLLALLDEERDRAQPDEVVGLLHRLAQQREADPRVFLALARAERTAESDDREHAAAHADTALALFQRYLDRGGDPAAGSLEEARALYDVGRDSDAVAAYHRGLAHLTKPARQFYRDDFAWIATPAELARFDSLPDDSIPAWADRFWALRDAEAIRRSGSRLPEHLRRWNYVYRHFRVFQPERRNQYGRVAWAGITACSEPGLENLDDLSFENPSRTDDLRNHERLLDQRAVIYMRHGEPVVRMRSLPGSDSVTVRRGATGSIDSTGQTMDSAFAATSDTAAATIADAAGQAFDSPRWDDLTQSDALTYWVYWFAGRVRVYQFSGSGALGLNAPTTLRTTPVLSLTPLLQLARIDHRYAKLAHLVMTEGVIHHATPNQCSAPFQEIRRDRRQDMVTAVRTDSYTLIFPKKIPVIVQTFAVGRPERGNSRLLVEFAIPSDSLVPQPRTDGRSGIEYRVTFRVTAVDTVQRIVRRMDTTRTFVATDTLPPGSALDGTLELAVPAGSYTVRAAIFQPGRGASLERPEIAFAPAAGALALSDLVLGRQGSGLTWTGADGARVWLNPLDQFPAGGELELYYELAGLRPGTEYRTAVGLRPEKEKNEQSGLHLVFAETAAAPSTAFRRSIDLAQLRPGRYILTVTVEESGSARTITRERTVTVRSKAH